MRLVLDTNVLVSALLGKASPPANLLALWQRGRYQLITAAPQLDELRRVTRYPKIRRRLPPALAGELINQLHELAEIVKSLPRVDVSPDATDNFLLSMASAGKADYLVSGDKRHIVSLKRYEHTRIVTVVEMVRILKSKARGQSLKE